jgi:carbonic anhydrase
MHPTLLIAAAATAAASPHASAPSHSGAHHWTYSGHDGPSHWGQLDSDYRLCARGKTQSPIDIRTKDAQPAALPRLVFNYRPSALHIVDNGHTTQVNVDPGSALLVGGKRYELVQFHFHHPSEEEINGRRFAMVAHLVHKDADGQLAVVAVPLRAGKVNALLTELWRNLPAKGNEEPKTTDLQINAGDLIPADHHYYAYSGSLTTPPCSEGVRWMVLKTPAEISADELKTFAARYPNNARPVQLLNGRHVLASK